MSHGQNGVLCAHIIFNGIIWRFYGRESIEGWKSLTFCAPFNILPKCKLFPSVVCVWVWMCGIESSMFHFELSSIVGSCKKKVLMKSWFAFNRSLPILRCIFFSPMRIQIHRQYLERATENWIRHSPYLNSSKSRRCDMYTNWRWFATEVPSTFSLRKVVKKQAGSEKSQKH